MTAPPARLVMIYNADGGFLNGVRDSFWKTFAPASYPCALCALAFGFFAMHGAWKSFLGRVPLPICELHRDDYRRKLPGFDGALPAIVLQRADGSLDMVANAPEMEAMRGLGELVALCDRRLGELGLILAPR
ncbi:MAG: hypothetical protein V2I27_01855 [Erythrobacter sp.]|jgi:hypothetical protein|nr:hypothetical protein [Erythrobacter sp.]